jgi:formylglycine-generating enzyme required for sulfatase activity
MRFLKLSAVGVVLALGSPAGGEQNRMISDLALPLIWVEAGSFLMGSPADESERHQVEGPQTRVAIAQGFWLRRDPKVTQARCGRARG